MNTDPLTEACGEDDLGARNACKLCTPLGACLAFRGVEGCIPFLHGSQGCSTYIRRYLISHFREPLDIASSNFHEEAAIFGGKSNLKAGLDNVSRQYKPSVVGLATTCLAETIGEDMPGLVRDYEKNAPDTGMRIVHVSTASYRGTHIDGFHAAVAELVAQLAQPASRPCESISSPAWSRRRPPPSQGNLRRVRAAARAVARLLGDDGRRDVERIPAAPGRRHAGRRDRRDGRQPREHRVRLRAARAQRRRDPRRKILRAESPSPVARRHEGDGPLPGAARGPRGDDRSRAGPRRSAAACSTPTSTDTRPSSANVR